MAVERDALALNTVLVTLVALALGTILVWDRSVPVLSADELGYLANAQLLASGKLLNMGSSQFYFGGYALFLVPLDWMFNDPRSLYRAALVLNAAFIAATVPALVRLSSDFGFPRSALTPWFAVIFALWPSQLFQAYLSLPEIGLRLIMLCIVLVAFALVRRASLANALLLAALAVLSYAFHARSIIVLPIAMILLAVCVWRRSLNWVAIAAAAAVLIAGFFAVERFNAYLQSTLWMHTTTSSGGPLTLARRILEEPLAMALRSLGHGWYQVVSTLLLLPLGLAVALIWSVKETWSDRGIIAAFVVLLTLGIGAAGSANMISPDTIDWLIYSRFLDVITPVLAWVGLLAISEPELRARFQPWIPWLVTASLVGGVFLYLRYAGLGMLGPNIVEVGTFAPLIRMDFVNSDAMARTMLFAPFVLIAVSILVYYVAPRRALLLVVLACFCTLMTLDIGIFYRDANKNGEAGVAKVAEVLSQFGDTSIYMDRVPGGSVYIQQFMLERYYPPLDIVDKAPLDGTLGLIAPGQLEIARGECLMIVSDGLPLIRFAASAGPPTCPQ